MTDDKHLVLVFDSIHDVIRAEKIIRTKGIACELIPTPREVSADCGMAVECPNEALPHLVALREAGVLQWIALYPKRP